MKTFRVVDLVAIACELWDCDAAKALDRLDLSAIERAVTSAFGDESPPDESPPDPSSERPAGTELETEVLDAAYCIPDLPSATAKLVTELLTASAAGDDTRRFALLAAACLASANGHVLAAPADEIVQIFDGAGYLTVGRTAAWFASHLVRPTGEVSPPAAGGASGSTSGTWGLSKRARQVIATARDESERFGHPMIGTEHLLLGILLTGPSSPADLLNLDGIRVESVRREIVRLVGGGYTAADRRRPLTPRAQRVLQAATVRASREPNQTVEPWHLLAAIREEDEGLAAKIIDRLTIRPGGVPARYPKPSRRKPVRGNPPSEVRRASSHFAVVPATSATCVFCGRGTGDGVIIVASAASGMCNLCLSKALAAVEEHLGGEEPLAGFG